MVRGRDRGADENLLLIVAIGGDRLRLVVAGPYDLAVDDLDLTGEPPLFANRKQGIDLHQRHRKRHEHEDRDDEEVQRLPVQVR